MEMGKILAYCMYLLAKNSSKDFTSNKIGHNLLNWSFFKVHVILHTRRGYI